ncbi:hypothetical protein HaLaN_28723, partial [Haematococcus lacustris]
MAQPSSAVSSTSAMSTLQFGLVVGCSCGGLFLMLCITACAVRYRLKSIDEANAADIKARLAARALKPSKPAAQHPTQAQATTARPVGAPSTSSHLPRYSSNRFFLPDGLHAPGALPPR